MKKFLVILLIASSLFTVIGCSGGADDAAGANAASPEPLPSTNPDAFTTKPEDK